MGIVIKHAEKKDIEKLAVNLPYDLPAFDRDDWVLRAVLEEDSETQMALLLRKTCEAYLLIGPEVTEKAGKILALQKEASYSASRNGYHDIHAWLPPSIEKNFGRHLLQHGWQKPLWSDFVRYI